MAAVLILVSSGHGDLALGPDTLSDLAEIGVTSISLARDDDTLGIVLEGWAFDPERHGSKAADLLIAERSELRLLHVITQMAVTFGPDPARRHEGGE